MRFSTITRPKCTGSMPSLCTIGSRIGTRMVIAAVGSRKQPTKSISRLASSRNIIGSVVTDSTQLAIISVVRVAVSIQPKIEAAATMSSTAAVVSIVSIETFTRRFIDIERYQTVPRKRDQTQAAMAPSVAVKTPVVMPPISRTGVMMGSTASKRNFQSAKKISTMAPITVSWGCAPICTTIQIANGQPRTIISSNNAFSTRRRSNGLSPPHLLRCAKKATVTIMRSAITRPGRMPARKSAPTETLAKSA